MLVAAVCTPYGFFFDEVVLFPAVLAALYRAEESGRSLLPFALIAGAALCELLMGLGMTTPYYLWTTPAWLAWYLYATRSPRGTAEEAPSAA
jgi:DNA-binding transcriptional regulator/RsmH inhibitor MraZ